MRNKVTEVPKRIYQVIGVYEGKSFSLYAVVCLVSAMVSLGDKGLLMPFRVPRIFIPAEGLHVKLFSNSG